MTDQFGCEVVSRCICTAIHVAVKVKYFDRICIFYLVFYICDLGFHAFYYFICFIFYLENLSKVIEILIYIFYITAKFIAFDG